MQMLQLSPVYKKYDHFFLTFKRPMSQDLIKKEKVVFISDTRRNIFFFIKNCFQSLFSFLSEMPDIVIANGGGFVVPFCYIAKIFGKKIIFIESFSRVESPSISGILLHPISDKFIVQWKPLLKHYKKVIYGGQIL